MPDTPRRQPPDTAPGMRYGQLQIATLQQPVNVGNLCVKAGMAPPSQRLGYLGAHGGGLSESVGTAQEGKEPFHTSCHSNHLL